MVRKKREDVILVRVSEQEKSYLTKLAKELDLSVSELLRTSAKYCSGSLRRKHVKEFVAKAKAMPDPFEGRPGEDKVFDYTPNVSERIFQTELRLKEEIEKGRDIDHGSKPTLAQFARNQIDHSDLTVVEQLRQFYQETEPARVTVTKQDLEARIAKIFWYIDETDDSLVPEDIRNDLRFWRNNKAALDFAMGKKKKLCDDCEQAQVAIEQGEPFNPLRHARFNKVTKDGISINVWRCMICLADFDMRKENR